MSFFQTLNSTASTTLSSTGKVVESSMNTATAVTMMAEVAALESLTEQLDGKKIEDLRKVLD